MLFAAALVIMGGCGAVVHAERRRSKWYRLRSPLLPWWQTLPFAMARFRLPPFERDTWREQFGTTGELVAGVVAVSLGCIVIWVLKSGQATVR